MTFEGKPIICGVCKRHMEVLTHTHIAKHGLTQEEYLKRFPEHAYVYMWPDPSGRKAELKYIKYREKYGRRKAR